MKRYVDVEFDGTTFTIGCHVYRSRSENPDNWWMEERISSDTDIKESFQQIAEKGWDWYDQLMELTEKALIDLLEEERSRYVGSANE